MSEHYSFHGAPGSGSAGHPRVAGLVAVLLVVFLGVAVAKPWGAPAEPARTAAPVGTGVEVPAGSTFSTGVRPPSTAAPARVGPRVLDPFTTPVPPPASAAWAALRWTRLAPDDPLTLVTSVLRWRGGFVAVGWVDAGLPATPVWTSADGAHWNPLPSAAPTTFWPGLLVSDIAEVPTGLVAMTAAAHDCRASSCAIKHDPPVGAWTSPDGRTWTPRVLPADWPQLPPASAPLLAVGPAGVVAVSSSPATLLATSSDGVGWQSLPARTLPTRFVLNNLRGTEAGYVAVGLRVTGDTRWDAASLSSSDGRRWSQAPTLLPTPPPTGPGVETLVSNVIAGRDGLIAVGRDVIWPGAELWWQSTDGQRWAALPTFAPLGPAPCPVERCPQFPDGALVGDGRRLLAVRGGPDAAAWASSDGRSWQAISMSGDIPSDEARQATLLPHEVLLRDGTTTWFGEAVVP